MNCYVCATDGRPEVAVAVALCRVCMVGLCLDHLRNAASHTGVGGMSVNCAHRVSPSIPKWWLAITR
jgi:hypothetical protein